MCYNILVQTTVVTSIIAPLWQVSGPDGTYWNDSSAVGCNTPQIYGFDITEARIGNLYRCKVTDSAGNVVYSEPGKIVLLSETWSYKYNADGLRTSRSNGATTYNYIYNGSSLSQMTVGGNTLYFAYDASGTPMSVTHNGTNYYYVTNLQGDVTVILTIGGTAVVQYTYDAWGKLLSTTGPMAKSLGEINPLRYRGYVYDIETGLYYLQSRYYDPEMGKFLCHDVLFDTDAGLQGNNLFVYCGNNPVSRIDVSGKDSIKIEDVDITDDDVSLLGGGGNVPVNFGSSSGNIWSSFLSSLEDAASGLSMAAGTHSGFENHHIISNKNKTFMADYKNVTDRYDLDIDEDWNLIYLNNHRGRHTNVYNRFTIKAINMVDSIAKGNPALFTEGIRQYGLFCSHTIG